MNDVAKVIRLHDVDFEARHRPSRVWPEEPVLKPVTSLTDRLAEVEAQQPKSLGEMIRGAVTEGVGHAADFARRRLTGDYQVDEFGLDEHLLETLILPMLRPLSDVWFRVQVSGIENVPEVGGALIVANHAGTIPLDGLMLQLAVHDKHPKQRALRLLAADLIFQLPVVGGWARKAGHTLACPADAERLLRAGEVAGVFPEGFKGIGKPYSDRYKLQRFGRGGFVSAAVRTGVPIIPCSIVGSEEIYPKLADLKPLARLLGLPYFPVTPLFPHLGPLGALPLPSKWHIEFGEPIPTTQYEPADADDPMTMFEITDQVRETIQTTLYKNLTKRRNPFTG
ncbi:lysophospholipid acyltransferase family protein [Nocardia huaxiensis]|uniref:Acyltransferase family protein n=1 Tax=Nocardia huaxiensis TaxID=2755382 RepID=A0A7D6Z5W7_9NOCA|nr:lysophospholipid acyltransferase family protein [Nocardia huaxiensis]QLY32264.1 acyltransferase family protein [Nocardia huaxiensis]UFS94032.1 acyltransferase family protein [Nocardia huaxiensis]